MEGKLMVEAEEMETPFRADVLLISCCSSIVLERTTKKKTYYIIQTKKKEGFGLHPFKYNFHTPQIFFLII